MTALLVLAMLLAFGVPMAVWGAMILTEPDYPRRGDPRPGPVSNAESG